MILLSPSETGVFELPRRLHQGLTAAESLQLSLDSQANPAGFAIFTDFSYRTADQQQTIGDAIADYAEAQRGYAHEADAHKTLFDQVAQQLGQSVFGEVIRRGGQPVFDQTGRATYTRTLRASLVAGGAVLREQKTELAEQKDALMAEIAGYCADFSAHYLAAGVGEELQIAGLQLVMCDGYIADKTPSVPAVYGSASDIALFRRKLNGGNAPDAKSSIKAKVAEPENFLAVLGALRQAREF